MNISQLMIAAACSLTVIGASGVAFAQANSPDASNSGVNQNLNQNQGQTTDRTSNTGSTTSGNTNTTTQRQYDSATGTGTNDSMRNTDGSMRSERLARADRN